VQPITKLALTRQQILALIGEVGAPEDATMIAGAAGIRLLYTWNEQRWLLWQDNESPLLRLHVRKWVEKPSGFTSLPPAVPAPAPVLAPAPADDSASVAEPYTNGTHAPAPESDAPQNGARDSSPADAGLPANAAGPGQFAPPPPTHLRRRASDRPFGPFAGQDAASTAIERLLREQVRLGAADLHLRVDEPPILRLGGDLERLDDEPALDNATLAAMLWSIMPDKNRAEFDHSWDTDFAHEIPGLSRFRVNVLRDRSGTAAVIRTIASNTVTVEEMGLSAEVQQLCSLTKGLVLVTGPTGSGKSTTLCAMVDLVNRTRSDHIITIEDPIEFVHRSKKCLITQRQVGTHTQSFKSALRAALREDPDIILVGELRDLETIAIAMETAETGHLVFGTLHTSTAASTINRIIDQFPADRQDQIRVMLAESLKAVVSQTLCKKIGGGRVAAREILLVNKAVSSLIREGKTVQINNVIQTQRKLGMETLNDALLTLVRNNTIEPLEAFLKCAEKKDMVSKLRALGYDTSAMSNEE
jgi:twitching motility protein PilT